MPRYLRNVLTLSVLLGSMIGVTACHQEKSVDYFLLHPAEIRTTYDDCADQDKKLTPSQSKDCIAVLEAIPKFRANLSELINDPNTFARNIMQAESKLAELQKSYKKAKEEAGDHKLINKLKRAIYVQELEIESRFALIRLVTRKE